MECGYDLIYYAMLEYNNNLACMAFVIEAGDSSPLIWPRLPPSNSRFNSSFAPQNKNNFISISEALPRNHHPLTAAEQRNNATTVLTHLAQKIYRNISLLLTLRVDSHRYEVLTSCKVMAAAGTPAKIAGRERRKLITKYLCSRAAEGQGEWRLAIDVETGELKFASPGYRMLAGQSWSAPSVLLQTMVRLLGLQLRAAHFQLQMILPLAAGQFRCANEDLLARQKDGRIVQNNRFLQFANVFLNLASEASNEEQDLNQRLRKEADSFQRLRENRVALGKEYRSAMLFGMGRTTFSDDQADDKLQLTFIQRQFISERLSLPLGPRKSDPHQNFFVLNYIKVNKKLSQTMIKKIKVGGFTTIYLSEIEYWYVGSYCAGVVVQQSFEGMRPLKKYIIIKREERKVCGKSRVAHERFILTKIKFGVSMFLPKYYLLAEKDNLYENDLLVDYIPSPNLSEYIARSKQTLSFNTKLYFVWTIAQALRYLKEYSIAHLDLKPSNIMTHRRLCLKLIDFGESYHPDLHDTHQPGFSMPYSAPENYAPQPHYDSKNDVFSLGVIVYELFFGKYPFFLHDEDLRRQVYSQGTYQQYWLETPEEALPNGDPLIMPILYSVMLQCLREDPRDRPELEWIALLFREFIEFLK